MKKFLQLFLAVLFISSSYAQENPESVTIGTQVWMKKNLDVDHLKDGTPIPEVKDAAEWSKLTYPAWCYYNNDPANGKIYGKLYNWYAVNDPRGLAPEGWHVPGNDEWIALTNQLGGQAVAGGKMKSTTNWKDPNTRGTNSSGFTGLPGGFRVNDGSFFGIGYGPLWWSSTEVVTIVAWYISLTGGANIEGSGMDKRYGLAVRCIQD